MKLKEIGFLAHDKGFFANQIIRLNFNLNKQFRKRDDVFNGYRAYTISVIKQ